MGVSPFFLFLKRNGAKNASLKSLGFAGRGSASAKLYKALPAAEKAALVKDAKATPRPPLTKVRRSVLGLAVARGLPLAAVRKSWYKTAGTTTIGRLHTIAKKVNVTLRTPSAVAERAFNRAVAVKKLANRKKAAKAKAASKRKN